MISKEDSLHLQTLISAYTNATDELANYEAKDTSNYILDRAEKELSSTRLALYNFIDSITEK